jgi:GT2 family glycosyltransferase
MALDIIIVNYNSGGYLSACLESLDKTTFEQLKKIFVFDNGSGDSSVAQARERLTGPAVEYIMSKTNIGFAAAVNKVIARTHGDLILLVNQDMIVLPGAVDGLVRFMEQHPRCAVAGGEILKPDGSRQLTCRRFPGYFNVLFGRRSVFSRFLPANPFSRRYMYSDIDYTRPQKVDFLEGSLLLIRRKALDDCGVLDDRFFMYLEDADLSYRLHLGGWETWWVDRAYAIHFRGENTRKENIHPMIHHSRSFYTFFNKHYQPGFLLRLVMKLALCVRLGYVISTESAKAYLR